jgi:hypothetical protein
MSAMQLDHGQLEELIVADVLDGLDEADHQELAGLLASHGPDCQECRRLLTEYSEVAARLAAALEPEPLSASAEERLMVAAGGDSASAAGPEEGPVIPEATLRFGEGKAARGRAMRWAAAAAVAAALALVTGAVGYVLAPRSAIPTRVATFPSTGGQVVHVAFRPGDTHGFILGANLSSPPGSKVYELWFQPAAGAPMEPAGTFVPRGGSVVAPVTLGRSFVALAVSVEPAGGSSQPTSPPILLTKV